MNKNKFIGIGALCVLTVGALWGVSLNMSNSKITYADGQYFISSPIESNGYYAEAMIYVESGVISDVVIDARTIDGVLKSELSKSGNYIMTEYGMLIHQQFEEIERFIVMTNSTSALNVNENGKTDAIASVSISVAPYISIIDEVLNDIIME